MLSPREVSTTSPKITVHSEVVQDNPERLRSILEGLDLSYHSLILFQSADDVAHTSLPIIHCIDSTYD